MVLYCGPQFSLARAFDMRNCYSAVSGYYVSLVSRARARLRSEVTKRHAISIREI